jgi:predicted MFS family arabinose efflux permease
VASAKEKRIVALLAASQAMLLINNVILISLNGIVGYTLAANKALATLPVTCFVVGTAVVMVPASLWMARVGRSKGFITGAACTIAGSLVCALAVWIDSFALLCAGTFLVGGYNAFGQYYRFAAADSASPAFRPRAISLVLAGGILGAVIGPEMSKYAKDLLSVPFTATYLFLAGAGVVALAIQCFTDIPAPAHADQQGPQRPLREIVRQEKFLVALLCGMFGYAIMNFLMTAAPIAMVLHQHEYADAAFVIEWHAIAMFAPSFVTGSLIKRFGAPAILRTGAWLALASLATAAFGGLGVAAFWSVLVLLGIGWNFLYIGGTSLLTETYRPAERFKAQATNDQMVFLATAASSVLSGWLLQSVGWPLLAYWCVPLPVAILVAVSWLSWRGERARVADEPSQA